jgi:hypothetical protein
MTNAGVDLKFLVHRPLHDDILDRLLQNSTSLNSDIFLIDTGEWINIAFVAKACNQKHLFELVSSLYECTNVALKVFPTNFQVGSELRDFIIENLDLINSWSDTGEETIRKNLKISVDFWSLHRSGPASRSKVPDLPADKAPDQIPRPSEVTAHKAGDEMFPYAPIEYHLLYIHPNDSLQTSAKSDQRFQSSPNALFDLVEKEEVNKEDVGKSQKPGNTHILYNHLYRITLVVQSDEKTVDSICDGFADFQLVCSLVLLAPQVALCQTTFHKMLFSGYDRVVEKADAFKTPYLQVDHLVEEDRLSVRQLLKSFYIIDGSDEVMKAKVLFDKLVMHMRLDNGPRRRELERRMITYLAEVGLKRRRTHDGYEYVGIRLASPKDDREVNVDALENVREEQMRCIANEREEQIIGCYLSKPYNPNDIFRGRC